MKNISKLISGILTIAILSLILFAGPANAFSGSNKDTTFIATLDPNYQTDSLILNVKGDSSMQTCTFNTNGEVISGCEGITIQLQNRYSYDCEYGYGYGSGNTYSYKNGYNYCNRVGNTGEQSTTYEIVLDSNVYSGNYESWIETNNHQSPKTSFSVK